MQRLLGHKSATLTLDRYGHLFPDDLDAVADAFDSAADAVRTTTSLRVVGSNEMGCFCYENDMNIRGFGVGGLPVRANVRPTQERDHSLMPDAPRNPFADCLRGSAVPRQLLPSARP